MKYTSVLAAILLILLCVSFGNVLPIETAINPKNSQIYASKNKTESGKVKLLAASTQGVTIQLSIEKSDFDIDTLEHNGEQFQSLSFANCHYTTEHDSFMLPMQTALIGVPSDARFTVRILESTEPTTIQLKHRLKTIGFHSNTEKTNRDSNTVNPPTIDGFLPNTLAQIATAGQIRENHVLPLKIYPVQYNPATRIVKLYHRIVVEVQFISDAKAPSAIHSLPRPESDAYVEMYGKILINPETAKQWRSPITPLTTKDGIPTSTRLTEDQSHFQIQSAPTITSPRYKITISESGMYHITASDLTAAGADITSIRPNTISLSNKGKQIPIYIRNYRNGQTLDNASGLDADTEIIFYGQRHSGENTYIDPNSDVNVYWLSWNDGPGLRMETAVLSSETNPSFNDTSTLYQPNSFLTRVHLERDLQFRRFKTFGLDTDTDIGEFGDGILLRNFNISTLPDLPTDSWFWAQLSAPENRDFPFSLHGVAGTGAKASIRVILHGRSEGAHETDLWLNNNSLLGSSEWIGDTEYRFENRQISQSNLRNGKNTLNLISPGGQGLDLVMLNWFEVDYWRTYEANNNVLPFSITSLPDEPSSYGNISFRVTLKNFKNPNIEIYAVDGTRFVGIAPIEDEDNPGIFNVDFQSGQIGHAPQYQQDGQIEFNTSIQYIALTKDKYQKPVEIIKDTPSDLKNTQNGTDYIIITDTEFVRDAQPLANFRSQQGLRSKIVEVQDIYDEFNHGISNPYALRDFLKYTYHNWQPPAPTYVLLLGDTNLREKSSTVPTIQIQVPGYGSSASDHQFVTIRGNDQFPDMLIGRVPVTNSVEARIFVERAINYETNGNRGPWHKRILMLAGSDADFHHQTDSLVEHNHLTRKYETQVIYAPPTAEDELTLGEGVTPVGRQVIDGFNAGSSLVNYVGHGGGGRWASSRMMDLEDPHINLRNISELPFVISMTCFTGAFDIPGGCLAEEFLRSENGGAIAVFGGTSIGLLLQDHILNRELFKVIFDDKTEHLGAIVAEAKTNFLILLPGYPDLANIFMLFGDPATKLNLPHTELQVTTNVQEVKNKHEFVTGTELSVSGKLPNNNFNGDAEITVLSNPIIREIKKKRTSYRTPDIDTRHALDNTPRIETVQVVDGKFETQIQLPYNSEFEAFNLRVYAWNTDDDAIGYAAFAPIDRYIKSHQTEPYPAKPEQPIHIVADVTNHKLIDKMTLFWSDIDIRSIHQDTEQIPMVRIEGNTFKTEEPIPFRYVGRQVDYTIQIKPIDGHILHTEIVTFDIGEADLTVLEDTINWSSDSPYLLSVQILNDGTVPSKNIPVHFFQIPVDENVDTQDITRETLENATLIGGKQQILSEVSANEITVVGVPWTPPPGKHLIAILVDMTSDENPYGVLQESNEFNNFASTEFDNNRLFLTPDNIRTPIQSPDGIFHFSIPDENDSTLSVITFETEALTIPNQPDITYTSHVVDPAPSLAYRLDVTEETELQGIVTFVDTTPDDPNNYEKYIYKKDDETGNWIRIGQQIENDDSISAEVTLPGTFALLSHSDSTPPTLSLTVENQGFIEGDYIPESPTFTARIEDANGIDPHPDKIILTQNGKRIPQDEYTLSTSATNTNLLLVTYSPTTALQSGNLRIRLQAHDANGNVDDAELTAKVAGGFEIKNIANFPNPFKPGQGKGKGTDFAYYLTQSADKVSLKIYTLTGKLITSVDTLDASTSYNEYHFEGLDADGDPLANGVYIYKFTATKDDERVQKFGKIVVIK
ncbi:hypothetical protein F4X73_13905 [Candidatus Poribacteria bacterium]|nr:hypothetical protein [Candidatus Poribacteria bacterium]